MLGGGLRVARRGGDLRPVTSCEPGCVCEVRDGHREQMFCARMVSWDAAEGLCVDHGMHLARIDSAAENTWVRETADSLGIVLL